MANITKPNFSNALWASGGAIVAPSDVKIATGWTAEVPPFQWENYSQNRQDQGIAHILQHGISTWDALTEYQAGASFVQGSNGKIYVAITTNTNQNPTTDTLEANWADIFKPGVVTFSTAGTTSWTVPAILKLGLRRPTVICIGGGGGGGGVQTTATGAGGGGGGGGGAMELLDLTGVTSVSVTVGAAGVQGSSGTSYLGLTGGTTTFGPYMSASGGGGGSGAGGPFATTTVFSGNSGGVGTGGDTNVRGSGGADGTVASPVAGSGCFGGNGGGAAFLGGGADGGNGAGTSGTSPGEGGSGGATSNSAVAGGNGAPGYVRIEW